ncbi:MAG: 3-hydroxybutyryl-CoA dehydrogenase [Deltaproteobacteria bacterium]|nr:3-hydroxybutyryl-CoA dehydrogenase [Deltaproteobacteria bacterium]
MHDKTIGVVGAGQMGAGIAQVSATRGFEVLLYDVDEEALNRALDRIKGSLEKLSGKGTLSEEEKRDALGRIRTATSLKSCKDAFCVIEAAPENAALKKEIFHQLGEMVHADAILASNTSSISITLLASVTAHPERVAGMHFMNPVPLMKLVEGIRGLQTSEETFLKVKALAQHLGKEFIEAKDAPGFVVNRILAPMINEAIYAYSEGLATAEDIDKGMMLGTNQPMGPLTLADYVGLDVILAVLEVLHEGFGDPKYRPAPLLRQYVTAGWLGRKSGRGFYQY